MAFRIYVLERSLRPPRPGQRHYIDGVDQHKQPRKFWPVECYASRKACDVEAAKRNTRSPVWEYRRRPQSLKLYGTPGVD